MSTSTSFWQFNPRFYRKTRSNVVFRELYWVLSFEFLAIVSLLAIILFTSIPESIRSIERRDREIERRRLEKLQGAPSPSEPSLPVKLQGAPSPSEPSHPEKSGTDSLNDNTSKKKQSGATS